MIHLGDCRCGLCRTLGINGHRDPNAVKPEGCICPEGARFNYAHTTTVDDSIPSAEIRQWTAEPDLCPAERRALIRVLLSR